MDYYDGNIAEWKNALLLSTLKDQSLRDPQTGCKTGKGSK
jgi:hypothetical protein